MRRNFGLLRNVSIAYPGTLGVTTEKGQQDVKPNVLDNKLDGLIIAKIRFDSGVYEVDAIDPLLTEGD